MYHISKFLLSTLPRGTTPVYTSLSFLIVAYSRRTQATYHSYSFEQQLWC